MAFPFIALASLALEVIPDLFDDDKPVTKTAMEGIGKAVSAITGTENVDEARKVLTDNPELTLKLKQEANRILEMEFDNLSQTQETMRHEQSNQDGYVRRARPTFLYIVAFSIAVEVIIALYAIAFEPKQIANLATVYAALATPQGIAAAMCGVYMKKRSDEKLGAMPKGLLSGLLK